MFKSIRSSLFWYYLYKFRKRFVIITILLFIIFLSGFIYADIVEYLTLRDRLDYLDFILPIKWIIIFGNIAIISYLIFSLFASDKKDTKNNKEAKEQKDKNEKITIDPKELENLSDREASFLHTRKLKTKADLIIDNH
jgi:uncharacterized membrane protein